MQELGEEEKKGGTKKKLKWLYEQLNINVLAHAHAHSVCEIMTD